MQRRIACLLAVCCWLMFVGYAKAEVDVENVRSIQSSGSPIDMALSGDGQMFFVLTNQGMVDIYTKQGQFIDGIQLSGPADRITSSENGDLVYLSDSASGQIKLVAVDFVQNITTEGSPYKGPENAPVVLAIFSDFQ